ncbi:MAG: hypothetical protein MUO75_02780, partial [Actinobacteria bacterium]|nr:hypothetical protein [Actinomycetota bacterium]
LWARTYGGTAGEIGYSSQQTADGGYIVAGSSGSFGNLDQVYLIKTNAFGDTLWTRIYGGASTDIGYSGQQTADRGYIVAGETNSFGNGYQVYVIKADSLGRITGVEEAKEGTRGNRSEARIRPNPFASHATVPGYEGDHFEVYDITGKKIGIFRGARIGVGLAAGVYFVRPQIGDGPPQRVLKAR